MSSLFKENLNDKFHASIVLAMLRYGLMKNHLLGFIVVTRGFIPRNISGQDSYTTTW